MAMATVQLPPVVPVVPADTGGNVRTVILRFAAAINGALRGAISASVKVTLVAGDIASTFNDTRLGPFSAIELMPMTANAKNILSTIWIEPTKGACTLHHARTPNADCTFNALIIGS